jgi:long-chain fatty acid transport protein
MIAEIRMIFAKKQKTEGVKMKKNLIFAVLVLCVVPMTFGQIVTNSNQSVQYIRMMSRNASTDIDAVYYNPAGLTQMKNGFHLALHNQTIIQDKTVENSYPFLNEATYVGDVNVPIFPNIYAVYKKDKLALFFGFGPNAGGGTADFKTGLPSFEIPISGIPALLTGMGLPTTDYSVDLAFKGSSIFLGAQAGASYALSDMISVSAGVRYITATNTYEGSIEDIMINPTHPVLNPTDAMLPAPEFFTLIGQPAYAAMTGDQEVNAKQTGTAIQPILGLFFKPTEKLSIGLRYEFNASLELENDTTVDDTGMFPDGVKVHSDIPAIFSIGLGYEITPDLRLNISGNYFFEKQADLDGAEDLIDKNTYNFSVGLEYKITEKFLLSTGIEVNQISVSEDFQSDLSHEISSSQIGFGGQFKLFQNLDLDFGGIFVMYSDAKKTINDAVVGAYLEEYTRSSLVFAIGLGYHF